MNASSIASLATAGGTLVLALATFASIRSANRSARIAERSFLVGLRPVLFNARPDDPPQKVNFADEHWLRLRDGLGAAEVDGDVILMAIPLRNVASGIAVLHGWHISPQRPAGDTPPTDPEDFRLLSRDLYIPAGDIGFWQGAIRDTSDPQYAEVLEAITQRNAMGLDLLYGDHEGGQRTISRFGLLPRIDEDTGSVIGWSCPVVRHWNLDRADPR